MNLVDGDDVLVADDAGPSSRQCFASGRRGDLDKLSDGALANVKRHFSSDAAREILRRVIPRPNPAAVMMPLQEFARTALFRVLRASFA